MLILSIFYSFLQAFLALKLIKINHTVSFSLDVSLLIKKVCSTEVDETGTDRISQATDDNLQSTNPL